MSASKFRHHYLCDKCDKVQLYERIKPMPAGVKTILLSSCIYCNDFMKVNYFLGYKMIEKNLELKEN